MVIPKGSSVRGTASGLPTSPNESTFTPIQARPSEGWDGLQPSDHGLIQLLLGKVAGPFGRIIAEDSLRTLVRHTHQLEGPEGVRSVLEYLVNTTLRVSRPHLNVSELTNLSELVRFASTHSFGGSLADLRPLCHGGDVKDLIGYLEKLYRDGVEIALSEIDAAIRFCQTPKSCNLGEVVQLAATSAHPISLEVAGDLMTGIHKNSMDRLTLAKRMLELDSHSGTQDIPVLKDWREDAAAFMQLVPHTQESSRSILNDMLGADSWEGLTREAALARLSRLVEVAQDGATRLARHGYRPPLDRQLLLNWVEATKAPAASRPQALAVFPFALKSVASTELSPDTQVWLERLAETWSGNWTRSDALETAVLVCCNARRSEVLDVLRQSALDDDTMAAAFSFLCREPSFQHLTGPSQLELFSKLVEEGAGDPIRSYREARLTTWVSSTKSLPDELLQIAPLLAQVMEIDAFKQGSVQLPSNPEDLINKLLDLAPRMIRGDFPWLPIPPEMAAHFQGRTDDEIRKVMQPVFPKFMSALKPLIASMVSHEGVREVFMSGLEAAASNRWHEFRNRNPDGSRRIGEDVPEELASVWERRSVTPMGSGPEAPARRRDALEQLRKLTQALPERIRFDVSGVDLSKLDASTALELQKSIERLTAKLRAGPRSGPNQSDPDARELSNLKQAWGVIDVVDRLRDVDLDLGIVNDLLAALKPALEQGKVLLSRLDHESSKIWNEALAQARRLEPAGHRTYAADEDDLTSLMTVNLSGCMNVYDGISQHLLMSSAVDPTVKQVIVYEQGTQVVRGCIRLVDLDAEGYQGKAIWLDWAVPDGGGSEEHRKLWVAHALAKAEELGVPVVSGDILGGRGLYSPHELLLAVAKEHGLNGVNAVPGTVTLNGKASPAAYSDNLIGYNTVSTTSDPKHIPKHITFDDRDRIHVAHEALNVVFTSATTRPPSPLVTDSAALSAEGMDGAWTL